MKINKVRSAIRRFLNKLSPNEENRQDNKHSLELERIKRLPRYTTGNTTLLGNSIAFADSASFLFMINELFQLGIYNFSSKTDHPLILDCGANIGLSVIYFKKLFPSARIIAFEPDEKIFGFLEKNIESFSLQEVHLVNKACWNEQTTLYFNSEGADSGRVSGKTEKKANMKVEAIRLKDYLNEEIDLLKIDIEGSEFTVLEDCKTNLHYVHNIFVEYHSYINNEQFLPEIVNILKDAGFRIHITAPGLTSPNPFISLNSYGDMDNQLNIFGFRYIKLDEECEIGP